MIDMRSIYSLVVLEGKCTQNQDEIYLMLSSGGMI